MKYVNSLFEDEIEDNPSYMPVADILKKFNIQFKDTKINEPCRCPKCHHRFAPSIEDGLESLIYSLNPNIALTETSMIPLELYETVCAILRQDRLEKKG